jgi:GT2 family glycosyltransferase
MNISVVIPTRNDLENLRKCIDYIKASSRKPFEILVIDDASVTDLRKMITEDNVTVIRLNKQSGPARARNVGAQTAKGDVILFLDSDVFIDNDTLDKITFEFENNLEDAVVGIFDDYRKYKSFFGDYKNLWMKYSYENITKRAALFYTSLAAIKKDVFLNVGGFDENHKRPSTEDTAFGNALWNNGIKPLISSQIKAVHNKEYSLCGILKTDFYRASDLLKMKLRRDMGTLQKGNRTSVPILFIISVFSTLIAFMLFFASGEYYLLIILIFLSIFLNLKYLIWLFKKRGLLFALKSAVFLPIDHFVIISGMAFGLLGYISGSKY